MKKILVPTDFSEIAANAFRFAQRLAAQEGGEITVIHAHHPSFDYSNPYLDIPAQEFEKVKRDLLNNFMEEQLISTSETAAQSVMTLPKSEIKIGFAAEEIVRASKEADLVIMGTTGEGNLFVKTFGSVSTYVASHAKCPVLLVPGKCKCEGFSNIVYASNHKAADMVMINQLIDVIGHGPANVHFVHVNVEDSDGEGYHLQQAYFEKTANKRTATDIGFNTVTIRSDDVQKGIIQYAEDIRADLIVTSTTQRSFLERLFHKSVTKDVVFHTTIPLMVLHYDD